MSGVHSQKHLIRSVFEGVAFGLNDSLHLIKKLGVVPAQVRVTGGGAKSMLWRQILADIFETEVQTMQADEGPAFGAALLAAVGAEVYKNVDLAVAETVKTGEAITPIPDNIKVYRSIYPIFTSLYKVLKSEYEKSFENSTLFEK
jgi:xylulokinase